MELAFPGDGQPGYGFPFGECLVTGGLYEAGKLGDGDLVSCQKEVIDLDVMNGFSHGPRAVTPEVAHWKEPPRTSTKP